MTRVAIIGAGNVATHLALALDRAGVDVVAVAARHVENAAALAGKIGSRACAGLAEIPRDIDFAIIAVNDSSVADVARGLPPVRGSVLHTSGSVPLNILAEYHDRAGVMYPLQTFSRDVPVDMSEVPFFTEATDDATLAAVDALAAILSGYVYHAGSDRRACLHVAGVLSSNFTVYLLEQCRRVLQPAGFPLDVVRPLVGATLAKAFAVGPHDAMTGPARRGDMAVVEAQASRLPDDVAGVYREISRQIYNMYNECD